MRDCNEEKLAQEKEEKKCPFANVRLAGRKGEDLANIRKIKRAEEEAGEEKESVYVCKNVGCSPCRRPRAIDSRASRSLRGRGTRERGTREGIPTGEGEEKRRRLALVGPGGHARKGESERERKIG